MKLVAKLSELSEDNKAFLLYQELREDGADKNTASKTVMACPDIDKMLREVFHYNDDEVTFDIKPNPLEGV